MRFCLDTNTCIYFLNGTHASVRDRLLAVPPGDVRIPSVVKAELLLGARKSVRYKDTLEKVERFLAPFEVVPFGDAMAYEYAEIRFMTEKKGTSVGPNDLFIAAIVKAYDGVLVTHNMKEFGRIKGLKIVDWVG